MTKCVIVLFLMLPHFWGKYNVSKIGKFVAGIFSKLYFHLSKRVLNTVSFWLQGSTALERRLGPGRQPTDAAGQERALPVLGAAVARYSVSQTVE